MLLRDKINTPPTDPEPYQSKLSEFVALLDSSISDIDVTLWPQVPYAVDGVVSGTGGGMATRSLASTLTGNLYLFSGSMRP